MQAGGAAELKGWEKEAKEQDRVDEVLAFYYFSEEGMESQRQAAE